MSREKEKLSRTLGGIRDMGQVPSVVWIVDTNKEALAVAEARNLHIPVVAILDTNCDPDVVDYPVPGNDDAIRAVGLLTRVIADAAADGLMARAGAAAAATEGAEVAEPMPEWEREVLATDGEAKAGEEAAAAGTAEASVPVETVDPVGVPQIEVRDTSSLPSTRKSQQKQQSSRTREPNYGRGCCRRSEASSRAHRRRNDGLQASSRRSRR